MGERRHLQLEAIGEGGGGLRGSGGELGPASGPGGAYGHSPYGAYPPAHVHGYGDIPTHGKDGRVLPLPYELPVMNAAAGSHNLSGSSLGGGYRLASPTHRKGALKGASHELDDEQGGVDARAPPPQLIEGIDNRLYFAGHDGAATLGGGGDDASGGGGGCDGVTPAGTGAFPPLEGVSGHNPTLSSF